jgi:hypothetical protein
MIKNIGIAVLLLSGLYIDVELWACKQAAAQDYDYTLPDGSVVHRHVLAPTQCLRVGIDPHGFDWEHDGPCGQADFARIDEDWHIEFRKLTKTQLEAILAGWTVIQYSDRRMHQHIAVGRCMMIPASNGAPVWFHDAPCNADDIAKVTSENHITFFSTVTPQRLQYAIALSIHLDTGLPIAMADFPQYRGE